MSKEDGKEIGKEFSPEFLPCVKEKTTKEVLEKFKNNPTGFTLSVSSQIQKDNQELSEFLISKAGPADSGPFLEGASFTYQSLLKETPCLPYVSKQIIQTFDGELLEKVSEVFKQGVENLSKELQQVLDEMSFNDNLPGIFNALHSLDKKGESFLDKLTEIFHSIISLPGFYLKENRFLMENIEKISSDPDVDPIRARLGGLGAMVTYELLRRQAKHQTEIDYFDYLEKQFKR